MSLSNLFRRSEFIAHTATLLTGTLLAQVVFVVFSPVLARLFSPTEFGLYTLFISILNPLSIVATGRYEQAIVIPEKEEDASSLYFIVIILSFIIAVLLFLALLLFNGPICHFLKAESLGAWLYLLPVSLVFLSFSQSSTYWFIRKKTFRASAVNKISQSTLNMVSSLSLGLLNIGKGLIIGDTVGKFGLSIVSIYQSVKSGLNFRKINIRSIYENLLRFKQFPLFNTLPSLLVTLSFSIPIFYLTTFYSGEETGFVSQTRTAIFIPLSLISAALSQVMLNRFSEKRRNKESVNVDFRKIFKIVILVALLIILVVQIKGVALFKLVFGSNWARSGNYARILVFSYAIQFVVSPFSIVFVAFDKIKILSFWQLFYFILIMLLYFFKNAGIVDFLIIYTLVETFCFLIYLALIFLVIRQYENNLHVQ